MPIHRNSFFKKASNPFLITAVALSPLTSSGEEVKSHLLMLKLNDGAADRKIYLFFIFLLFPFFHKSENN